MDQLREEIITVSKTIYDITKWKLIIVSILSATALGLTEGTGGKLRYDIFLLVPFVCAYSDLAFYQHLIRIHVIARFLREDSTETEPHDFIRRYEKFCESVRRKTGLFDLDRYAQFGSSVLFSLAAPIIAVSTMLDPNDAWYFRLGRCAVWVIGIVLIVVLYANFRQKLGKIKDLHPRQADEQGTG